MGGTWVAGGNPPMRPDQANALPRSHAGSGPAPQSAFITAQRVVVFGTGPNRGIFVYSPVPANGTLIASITASAGTDPYGNAYQAGITVYDDTSPFLSAFAELISRGLFFQTVGGGKIGQVAAGLGDLLILSPGGVGDTQALIDMLPASVSSSGKAAILMASGTPAAQFGNALLELHGSLGFGQSTGLLAKLSTDAGGYPAVTDNAGLALNVSGSQLANIGGTTVTTVSLTSLGFLTVPAFDVEAGASYQVHASGSFTTGGSAPSSATFGVYWGGVGGVVLASLAVPAAGLITGASGLGWAVDAEVNWISTTQAETTLTLKWHTASGVAGSVEWFAVSNVSGLATGGIKNLSLGFTWGSVPASTSLQSDIMRAGRVA